jgi:hypothetical protein
LARANCEKTTRFWRRERLELAAGYDARLFVLCDWSTRSARNAQRWFVYVERPQALSIDECLSMDRACGR